MSIFRRKFGAHDTSRADSDWTAAEHRFWSLGY